MEDMNDDNGSDLAHRETCAMRNGVVLGKLLFFKRSVTENIIEESSIATLKYLLKVSPLETLLYMFIFHVLVSLFGLRAKRQYLGCITETVMQSILKQECELCINSFWH